MTAVSSLRLFLAAVVAAGAAHAAQAQSFGLDLGVASEYVGKGLGKSDGEIAPFAKAEVEAGGLYANAFISSASGSQGYDAEIVAMAGWRPEAAGLAFDLGVMNRDMHGSRPGVDENWWEIQADASRKLGPVATRFRVNYTPDGFAATEEAWWIELQGAVALTRAAKLSASVANRMAEAGADFNAWNVGVKHKLTDGLSVDLRWYDTDGHARGEPYEGRLVASAAYSF